MIVRQLLSGAGPYDAVTTEARQFRSWFRRWGWGGSDHAARIAPGTNRTIGSLGRLRPGDDDVLLIHHSAGIPGIEAVLSLSNPKLLLYHNVTPPDWLWEHAPVVALHCAIGREQLPSVLARVDVAAADSEFNAAELRALGVGRTEVIPLLIDRARLGPPDGGGHGAAGSPPTVLFVGRLSPHKRQEEVIGAFALYQRHRSPGARLILVGDPITPEYRTHLRAFAERLAPGAVRIESNLTDAALGERYRSADAFLCLSEHEGFCIPMLEAFHFGLPVIARPVGAVPETVGDAALLVDDPDLAVVAELLHLALTDRDLRGELRSRGERRLEAYTPEAVSERLRAVVEATAAAGRARLS
jgi:glycosyltransferase involved in cell wall biosynthesis